MLASILGLMSPDKTVAVARRWVDECEEKRTNDGRRKSSQASPSLFSFCHILQGRKFHPRRPPEIAKVAASLQPCGGGGAKCLPAKKKTKETEKFVGISRVRVQLDLRFINISTASEHPSEKKLTLNFFKIRRESISRY